MSEEFQLPAPGPHHEALQPFAGVFLAEVRMWMGPGDPAITTGRMTNTWVLNGLFLQQDYKGDDVAGPFPSFEGKGFWGFNTATGRYEGFWIDIASTMMGREVGELDDTGRIWTMLSAFPSPYGDGGEMKKRSVITLIDDDRHLLEAYIQPPGADGIKHMEIHYTRAPQD